MAAKLGPLLLGKSAEAQDTATRSPSQSKESQEHPCRLQQAVHTGVLVFGSEYWYGVLLLAIGRWIGVAVSPQEHLQFSCMNAGDLGGKVFRSNPPCRKQFGEPLKQPWGIELEQPVTESLSCVRFTPSAGAATRSEAVPELPVIRLGYTFVTHQDGQR